MAPGFPLRIRGGKTAGMPRSSAADVKQLLELQPHPREGGWYTRTLESAELLPPTSFASGRYPTERRLMTAIYYLLEPETFSEMHRLRSDEVFHHYLGGAVELLQLHPDGKASIHLLGTNLTEGERPQLLVPRGVWQGSRLLEPEGFALLGCTVSPGFEYEDYESATYAELVATWPQQAERLRALTRI